MANIRRMYLRAEMSDGDTVELLNFTVGSDGKVQKLDESSLDTLLDTPEVAKMWGNAYEFGIRFSVDGDYFALGGLSMGDMVRINREFARVIREAKHARVV